MVKDLNLIKELNIMKLPQNKINEIQPDMSDALQLEKYLEFVESLTKIVDIFIINRNTKIKNKNDKNWIKLKDNLKIAKYKKNNKNQNISDVARLFRDIKNSVKEEYDKIHIQWICTVTVCRETVHKMANDDEFSQQQFLETLQLLDDSNDGELEQLSGSLRKVHKQFSNIWQKKF